MDIPNLLALVSRLPFSSDFLVGLDLNFLFLQAHSLYSEFNYKVNHPYTPSSSILAPFLLHPTYAVPTPTSYLPAPSILASFFLHPTYLRTTPSYIPAISILLPLCLFYLDQFIQDFLPSER